MRYVKSKMSSPNAGQLFTSNCDPELPKPIFPKSLLRLAGITIALLFVMLLTMTDFLTRGGISSLPATERDALLRIGQSGIRIETKPITGFGAPAHIIPKVRWQLSTGNFSVTGVTLHNAEMIDIRPIIPELRKLSGLKEINAPYLTDVQIESVQQKFPNVVVSNRSN